MSDLIDSLLGQCSIPIRDALWKDVRLSPSFLAVFRTSDVQKLSRIKQLGPVFLIYPSAVHTRLDHSLGVYHLAMQVIISLVSRNSDATLSEQGIWTFLMAALLHDIGHFPYAHSLKELPLKAHETLAAEAIMQEGELHDAIVKAGVRPEEVAAIIDDSIPTNDHEILLFRNLLSGTLDPDKLDYLNRDAFFCGVPYGNQDASYITSHLTIAEGRPAIQEEALASIEHVLFAKYLMYRNVYWNKGTRSATAMIKKSLLAALRSGTLTPSSLYGLDDPSFFALAKEHPSPMLRHLSLVEDGVLFPCLYERETDITRKMDCRASTLEGRTALEEELYRELKKAYPTLDPSDVIIDIPEPITFESSMPVLKEDGTLSSFAREDQLFQSDISQVFTHCLRKTRIFAPSFISPISVVHLIAEMEGKTVQ